MRVLFQIALVATGGLARWGVALLSFRLFGAAFPWGTLLINLSGCLFLGWFATLLVEHRHLTALRGWLAADDLRLMVAVGFTGAYTTFSTFEFETHSLLSTGHSLSAVLYFGGSIFLGLLATHLGALLARGF